MNYEQPYIPNRPAGTEASIPDHFFREAMTAFGSSSRGGKSLCESSESNERVAKYIVLR